MKIEEKGRDAWQTISGYNQRNLVENTMFRIYNQILTAKKNEHSRYTQCI